jgi:molybdenum cofactor synthesis domain-containing protein
MAEMEINLLEKTELRIEGIDTSGTNLTDLAAAVAGVLELPPDKVMVIDVRPPQVSLDILQPTLRAESFFGRERALLDALAAIPGVTLSPDASIHSAGILGAIGLSEAEAAETLARTSKIASAIVNNHRARIRVFPTGFELQEGRIEDTNTPYLLKVFEQAGFLPEAARPVADHRDRLAEALAQAAGECGLAITTGGVGAEDKDFSVEAIQSLDSSAATPYLVHFEKGVGRHLKDGVRIAVGELNGCLLAALPGPHDEVRLAAPILLRGYKQGWSKQELARKLAETLRAKFLSASVKWNHAAHEKHHAGDER